VPIHKFSDFADEHPLSGNKIRLEDVLNKTLIVKAYQIGKSKQQEGRDYLTLQIELGGEERVIFTGGTVLIKQIQRYANELPFETTIKRINKYFTFT